MTRNEIHPGHCITLSNGNSFTVIGVPTGKYLMPEGSYSAWVHLDNLCNEDLTPGNGMSIITEIREQNGNVIWTKPVEMTVAEIEKALKIRPGGLRIKK